MRVVGVELLSTVLTSHYTESYPEYAGVWEGGGRGPGLCVPRPRIVLQTTTNERAGQTGFGIRERAAARLRARPAQKSRNSRTALCLCAESGSSSMRGVC